MIKGPTWPQYVGRGYYIWEEATESPISTGAHFTTRQKLMSQTRTTSGRGHAGHIPCVKCCYQTKYLYSKVNKLNLEEDRILLLMEELGIHLLI